MSDLVVRAARPAALGVVSAVAGAAVVLEIPPQLDPNAALVHKYPGGLSGYITGVSFQAPAAIDTAGNLHAFITDGSTLLEGDEWSGDGEAEAWLATHNNLCCFNSADFAVAATGVDGGKTFYSAAPQIQSAPFSPLYPKWLVVFGPAGTLVDVTGLLARVTYTTSN